MSDPVWRPLNGDDITIDLIGREARWSSCGESAYGVISNFKLDTTTHHTVDRSSVKVRVHGAFVEIVGRWFPGLQVDVLDNPAKHPSNGGK